MIRKLSISAIALILSLAFVVSGFASNGTQIGTVGARSTSMGSAFRGLADDWSTVFYNPAGLTQLGRFTIGASTGIIMPRGDYTPFNYPTDTSQTSPSLPFNGLYSWKEKELTPKDFYIPAMGVFFKPSDKYVIGLGIYAPFGLGAEFDIFSVPKNYGNPNAISKEKESFSDHQVINIQPTFAYQISEKLSVGLGLSYIWGKMILDQIKLPLNPLLSSAYAGLINEDQSHLIVENNLDGDGSALGANIGILYNITDKLSLGISGRYSTDLKLKGTMDQTYGYPGDTTIYALISSYPAENFPGGEAQKQQVMALFSGQNYPQEYKVEADLPLPWTIGAGLAFKVTPQLTLTADASLTNWSSWGDIIVKKVETGESDTLSQDWKNTIEMGCGFEFKVVEDEAKQLFLRGGFYTVDSPVPNETMNPMILDPARRYVITGGLGLNLGKVSFNLAGEYFIFPEKVVHDDEYVINEALFYPENYCGIYNLKALVITFGTTINL